MRTTEMIVLDNGQEAGAFLENGVYIETGPHKHAVQQTFFLYVYEPGGNRFEVDNAGARLRCSAPDWQPDCLERDGTEERLGVGAEDDRQLPYPRHAADRAVHRTAQQVNGSAEPLTGSVLLGVMTITAATLFLQIALTKFFSFRLWYHYAFMIISITMLGLSAASAVLALFERRLLKLPTARVLHLGALLFGASTLAALGVADRSRAISCSLLEEAGPYSSRWRGAGWRCSHPFSFPASSSHGRFNGIAPTSRPLYATDLAGAGLGCLLAVLGLSSLFTEQCIALAAALGFVAAVVFGPGFARSPRSWAPSAVGLVLCAGVGMLGPEAWGAKITLSQGTGRGPGEGRKNRRQRAGNEWARGRRRRRARPIRLGSLASLPGIVPAATGDPNRRRCADEHHALRSRSRPGNSPTTCRPRCRTSWRIRARC